jgi:hypothetical protein
MHSLSLSLSPFPLINGLREQVFTCKSAKTRVTWPSPQVAVVAYSGIICKSCLDELRRQAIYATLQARVMVLDYSRVLFAMEEFTPPTRLDGLTDMPAIIIVQQEQYDFALGYASAMADLGIMRDVALPWQVEKVCEFVDTMTGARALREFEQSHGIPSS